jgi:hypothetical protein
VGEIGWLSCIRVAPEDSNTVTGLIPNREPNGRPAVMARRPCDAAKHKFRRAARGREGEREL